MSSAHWTYECKTGRTYVSKPSRTQELKKQKKLKIDQEGNTPKEKTALQEEDIVQDKSGFADKLLAELSEMRKRKAKAEESSDEDD